MKLALALALAVSAVATSGCTTLAGLFTHDNVQKGCEEAIKGAHTVQDIAVILQRHGLSAPDAHELANNAATGALLITQVCMVADALIAENQRPVGATIAAR